MTQLFLYQPGDSVFHRIDAVSKLVWLLAVTGSALLISTPIEAAALLALVLATGLFLARLSPGVLIRRVSLLAILALWLFVFLSLTYPQGRTPIASIGPATLTTEGVGYGLALALRVLVFGTTSAIFALTTDPRRMIGELVAFGRLPYRLAFTLYAAIRFIPLLQSEARTILHAHAIRGEIGGSAGRLARLMSIRRLTVPLLAGAIRRVHTTAISMDSRGFGAHPTRTEVDVLERYRPGVAVAVAHVALLVFVILWRFVLNGGEVIRSPIG